MATDPEELERRNDEMMRLHLSGVPKSEIGKIFGVSRERVRQIVGNGTYRSSLVGSRFGRLVVTEEDPSRFSESSCSVLCDCGHSSSVRRENLIHGWTRSCGCLSKVDREGQRFGRLVVVAQRWPGTSRSRATCACDCGGTVDVLVSNIVSGMTRSCGCLRRGRAV